MKRIAIILMFLIFFMQFLYNSKTVKVAFIDSGININEVSIKKNIIAGYNFVDDNEDVSDEYGHGTKLINYMVSKIPLIKKSNIKIIPIKSLNSMGFGTSEDISKGIIYAVNSGARVISMSLSSIKRTDDLEVAIKFALNKGVIVLASVGNDGKDSLNFPASLEGVWSISYTKQGSEPSKFVNYGENLDFTIDGEGEEIGTSLATASVTGLIAMYLCKQPNLTDEDIFIKLKNYSIDYGMPGRDQIYGYGTLNVNKIIGGDLMGIILKYNYLDLIIMPLLFYLLWQIINKSKIELLFHDLSNFYLIFIKLILTFFSWSVVYIFLIKYSFNLIFNALYEIL